MIARPEASAARGVRGGVGSRALGESSLVVLTAAALAVALTYPLAFRIDRIGRLNTNDGRWSIWVVSWVAHALTTDPARLYGANIFYPHTNALAFSEANIAAGIVGAPVWALTKNPYLTHNIVVLVSFIAAYAGTYHLVRYLTGSRAAAAVSGVLYAFCPFIFARTAHIQLLLTGGIPFCMLAFHRLVDRPTVGRSVTLGVLMCVQALACAYYGVFVVLMAGLGTVVFAITRRLWRSQDYWIGIGLAAFVSIALTLPFFLPYLEVQREMGFARTLEDAREYSASPGAWLASNAWAHRWWLPAIRFNEVLFPGFITLALGCAGTVWLFRKSSLAPSSAFPDQEGRGPLFRLDVFLLYLLVAVFAFWSSFGPDAGLYWLFYKTIPFFTFLRAPARIGIVVVLALIVLAAPLLASLLERRRRPMAAATALGVLASLELAAVPLTQYRQAEPLSPVYRLLATLPDGPVIELPYWYQRLDFPRHAYYMLNSTSHWKPLINGYSDHIPQDFRDTVVPLSSFPTRESFGILGRVNTRYVVFHVNMYDAALQRRLLDRLNTYSRYLHPLLRERDVWLYEIVGWPH